MDSVILFSDSARGVYIPQHFAQSVVRDKLRGVNLADLDVLADADNLEHEHYWDIWEDVLDNAEIIADDGSVYTLYQDGDLWALCLDRMTEEERTNFGFDE